MSETKSAGGFTGDPAAALDVAGTSGCCGNPAQANLSLPEPDGAAATCCGTVAEAKAENACCGSAAKTDAVAAGSGCCG